MNSFNPVNDSYFPVQASVLSPSALEDYLLLKYPLKPPLTCHLFNTHLNHVYRIEAGDSIFFLRIPLFNWRSLLDVEEEVDLLNYLHENGVSVARPIKDNDGQFIQTIDAPEGHRYAVLFSNAAGNPCNISDSKQVYLFGQLVGKMHRCSDRFQRSFKKFPLDLDELLERPINRMNSFLSFNKMTADYLLAVKEQLMGYVWRLPRDIPHYGICHGDLHFRNIHFDSNDQPTLFDFDCFGYSWRGYELGSLVYNLIHSPQVAANRLDWQKVFGEFLSGYDSEKVLTPGEFNSIKVFGVIRHIWAIGLNFVLYQTNGVKAIMEGPFINDNIAKIKTFMGQVDFSLY